MIQIHALKSTSLSIGCEQMSEISKKLEKAGKMIIAETTTELEKSQNIDFIKANHFNAMTLYDKLSEECQKYLNAN